MDFKFNFFSTEAAEDTQTSDVNSETTHLIPAQKIFITELDSLPSSETIPELPGILKRTLSFDSPFSKDSDVITGVYEGGFKTWECSIDLAQYLRTAEVVEECKRILELGCGSALPSITARLMKPSLHLTLQDYNEQVIHSLTASNLALNAISASGCDFYCGDWSGLEELLPASSFDLILTSETIYRVSNYRVLLGVFAHALTPKGRVLVAAKDYYFGLGGSVEEFSSVARSCGWLVRRVWTHDEGVPRSILELEGIKDTKID